MSGTSVDASEGAMLMAFVSRMARVDGSMTGERRLSARKQLDCIDTPPFGVRGLAATSLCDLRGRGGQNEAFKQT